MEDNELDLGPIEERLNKYVTNPFFAPGPINEDSAALLAEVKKLREQVAAYENGLECLEGFISQFPGYVMLQQMIRVWFSDARGTEI